MTGESASRVRALAPFICAEERLVAVAVHGVGLTLMTKQTRRGGESGVLAGLNLAPVRLEVGIHKFAARGCAVVSGRTSWRESC